MKEQNYSHIDKEQFEFVQQTDKIMDVKFDTKPVGYYKDAFRRFCRNKVSLAAAFIIIFMVLFSIFVPLFSNYDIKYSDQVYKTMRPKSKVFGFLGWNGKYESTVNQKGYDHWLSIGMGYDDFDGEGSTLEAGLHGEGSVFMSDAVEGEVYNGKIASKTYTAKIDSYKEIGFKYKLMNKTEFLDLWAYQQETGNRVIFPMVDRFSANSPNNTIHKEDANYWYQVNRSNDAIKDANGLLKSNYLRYSVDTFDSILQMDFEAGDVRYYELNDVSTIRVRIWYEDYYRYIYGHDPVFAFGTNDLGQDIMVRIAIGMRISLLLGVFVAVICFIIGAVVGAIEGYYGGLVDLITERILDILVYLPFVVIITIFKVNLVDTGKVSSFVALLFAFMITGWIGTSGLVRTQFYRFKNQEYVLAARTLGARDRRIMFKHIFPNTLGTIITSSALAIPGVIGTEATLAYLRIINISETASIGTMLSDGQRLFSAFPHIIFFPALAITLLMVAFNLFGNGLRDAFNPALRGGAEE